jgi:predicted transcriptional regulator
MCKEEFDRLMETSPVIPDAIISNFKSYFKDSDNYIKIVKPEICDVLISTDTFRNPWSNDENKDKKIQDLINTKKSVENKQNKIVETQNNIVLDFKKMFNNLHNREPLITEITDNLKDQIELSILNKIIAAQASTGVSENINDNTNNI